MTFERPLFRQDTQDIGTLAPYMGISLGCHLVLAVCMILLSGFNGCERNSFSSRVISVDLVSGLPGAPPGGGPPAAPRMSQPEPQPPAPAKKAENVPEPKAPKPVQAPPTPQAPAAIPMAPAKPTNKVKTALKEKTFNPAQNLDKAIARLEKKVEQKKEDAPESTDSINQALSRLRQAEENSHQSVTVSGSVGGGGGPGLGGPAGGGSNKELEAIDIYKLEIRYHILKNWVFSSQLVGADQELKTVIGIKIDADGTITDTWFDRKSGNEYYDDSAYKAVLKSNPLPRLPDGFRSYTVGLEFTPSDMY
ncbi:MAG: TonB C-terminal domain-containing protein [Thermodesulfobacteriota bacterium]